MIGKIFIKSDWVFEKNILNKVYKVQGQGNSDILSKKARNLV